MRSIKFGLALVAALAFSVAMTGSASAALSFLSSVSKANLLSENVAEQVLKTNAGEIKCTEAKVEAGTTGTAGVEESSLLLEIRFAKCLAFGFVPTTISVFHILILPDGTIHILKLFRVVGGGCELHIVERVLVGTLKYTNNGNNIKLEPNVTSLLYSAKSCPSGNGEAKNGTFTGNMELMISGGTLSFMP